MIDEAAMEEQDDSAVRRVTNCGLVWGSALAALLPLACSGPQQRPNLPPPEYEERAQMPWHSERAPDPIDALFDEETPPPAPSVSATSSGSAARTATSSVPNAPSGSVTSPIGTVPGAPSDTAPSGRGGAPGAGGDGPQPLPSGSSPASPLPGAPAAGAGSE